MRRSIGASIGVGGSSILVIFVLLCLTTFATLSLVSANADLKLTQKTAAAATEYYAADARAEEILARVDTALAAASKGSPSEYLNRCSQNLAALEEVSVEKAVGTLLVGYEVPINENRSLRVLLVVHSMEYAGNEERRFLIRQWQDFTVGEWQDEDSLSLWDGGSLAAPL